MPNITQNKERGRGAKNLGHDFWNNRNDKYAFFWKLTIIYEWPITSPIADSLNFSSKTFAPFSPSFFIHFFSLFLFIYFGKEPSPSPFGRLKTKRIAKISIFDIALGKVRCVCLCPELAPACNGASPTASLANKSSNLGRRQIAEKLTNF